MDEWIFRLMDIMVLMKMEGRINRINERCVDGGMGVYIDGRSDC